MTLILATKYSDGVMYCYDTAAYDENQSIFNVNKVLQAKNTPIVRGISGVLPSIDSEDFLLNDISKFYNAKWYNSSKNNSMKTILKTVNKYGMGSLYFIYNYTMSGFKSDFVKECGNEYIFSWPQKNNFMLLNVNSLFMSAESKSCIAIGSGAYMPVKEFLYTNSNPDMDESLAISTLTKAFDIALVEDKKAFNLDNSHRLLCGKALAKHTIKGLEQILFESA